ncbi:MAG TPA: TAT-variant-translocated molybdopterin oxidoreductase [Chitinophagaceae bacterium]|nr:TAT-variant-translocated molybdopterin oxidoreductase [Chitinophagaceae bacterium]
MEKKYWQSFGELNNSEAFQKSAKDEFQEELPFESNDKGLLDAKTPRRDFLKYLGFTTAAAAVAASCEVPVKKAIPFANKPEDIVPGVSNYYATTYVQDGDAVSIVAKVRDGRPIKIEGNELCPITQGGTSARVQASVLDLYDGARLRFPTIDGKETTFEAIDKAVAEAITGKTGIVLLSSTVNSPSSLTVIQQFLAKYPGSKHVTYDAISYSGILLANEANYGKKAIPSYKFDNAKVIVSVGADFLGTWISPIEFAKQYATGRKINEANPEMNKHIQFESVASLTGSNADERFLHRPSETGAIVAALLSAVNGAGAIGINNAELKAGIEKTAKTLVENKGASLVVCGSNDVSIQIAVNAINEALQAGGKTIDWSTTYNVKTGVDADFAKLVDEMNAGSVGALLVIGANPVYSWFDSAKLKTGLEKVSVKISFNSKPDETTQVCKYVIPDHHFLESWGDAEAKTGHFSFIQPTIYPLFKTRQWQDSLLKWSGATTDYLGFLKSFWSTKLVGSNAWDKALQDGVSGTPSSTLMASIFNGAAVQPALAKISAIKIGTKTELQLYQKIAIGAGQGAANPWLQEMPDPVTRATWDNYLVVSPAMAKTLLNIDLNNNGQADNYEVQPPKKVVEIKVNGKTIKLPALIIPGTHKDTVGIAVGYGRDKKIGRTVVDNNGQLVGANVFPFAAIADGSVSFDITEVDLKLTDEKYPVALTQTHNIYNTDQGNRIEVMKELTFAQYKKNPKEVLEEREHELKPYGGLENFKEEGTIYKPIDKPGIKWGMSIDLNACNGCGACVVACTAENNVAVVGKPEVLRFHDMQWLRIDRYYTGNLENPTVVFQPLMCQHCDNAPCENVCPVAATNHSSEGLNQMTYNRCIGTRYCANNCPYKVRRFNWADYSGADSFKHNQDELNDTVHYMNDDLTRMVLNPDVTVRSRGVIEKCSFCVQRLQEGKLKAKKESRPLETGGEGKQWDLKVACQQSCPTNAIVFGNANDSKSAVSVHRTSNNNRIFYSLEQLHVLPNVSYLAKVRNLEGEHKVADISKNV